MIVFYDAMEIAAREIESGTTLRLMMILPKHLDFTTFRLGRIVELAEELKVGSSSISRGMTELLNLGFLERKGKGPRQAWRMTTKWGWNGTVDQYHAMHSAINRLATKPKGPEHVVAEDILRKDYALDSRELEQRHKQPALRLLRSIPQDETQVHAHKQFTKAPA